MRLVAWSITARTQAGVPPGRSAVKKSQARIASAWERRNSGQVGPARREVDSGLLQNLLCCRRCYLHSQAGQLAVDPAVAPFGVVAGQPEDEGPDIRAGGRAAGLGAHGLRCPAAADDVVVPAQDRVRGDQQPQPVAAGFGITLSRVASRARSARSP